VLVVAFGRVPRAPGERVKTDRRDTRELAQQYGRGQLKGIAIPTRAQPEWRQMSRTYEQALSDRKRPPEAAVEAELAGASAPP